MATPPAPSGPARALAFLHRHPIFTLALLTPGIPEYVLGSSNLALLVVFPPLFAAFLLVNVALYTGGALLIREAILRWNKGFATLIALGVAYAVAEEGIGTATFFDPHTSAAGSLGSYGHFLGVNWVFTLGVIGYHVFVSIGLPIALLGRILPETRGRSLLPGRRLALVLALFVVDVGFVMFPLAERLTGFVTPWPLVVGCVLAIAGLVALGRWLPRDLLISAAPGPIVGAWGFALLGAAFEPAVLIAEAVPAAVGIPAAWDLFLVGGVGTAFAAIGLRWIGRRGNDRAVVALSIGVVASLMTFGLLITWPVPATLVAGGIALFGLIRLYRSLPAAAGGVAVPHVPPGSVA